MQIPGTETYGPDGRYEIESPEWSFRLLLWTDLNGAPTGATFETYYSGQRVMAETFESGPFDTWEDIHEDFLAYLHKT
jgi:hypothetical protein